MDISYYKQYEPIDGKWYLTKEIGRGAFGVVFEAERRDMINAKSAIKVVSIPSSQNEINAYRQEHYSLDDESITSYFYGFVEAFLKEIKMMSLFQGHRNIVNIEDYEVKQRKDEIGWDIFIKMELLTPVNKYFAKNGITESDVLKLGIDMCTALEECKKKNVIHRDIKPSNIFVSSTGDFKLGDFGVARTLEKTSSGFSKKGTYTYMAPEVYKGEDYDSSIDIYSLGIVMYKLLNNNFEPFRTENTFNDEEKALISRMKGDKKLPNPINADEAFSKIILKACSFDSKERYASPTQMRKALETLLDLKTKKTIDYSKNNKSDDETIGIFDKREKSLSDNEVIEFQEQVESESNLSKETDSDEKIVEKDVVKIETNSEKIQPLQKMFCNERTLKYSEVNIKYYRSIHILVMLLTIWPISTFLIYNIFRSTDFFDYSLCIIGICFFILSLFYVLRYTTALSAKQHNTNESKDILENFLAKYNEREAKYISSNKGNTPTKGIFGIVLMIMSALFFFLFGYAEISARVNIKMDRTFEEILVKNLDFAGMLFFFIVLFIIGYFLFRRGKQLVKAKARFKNLRKQKK